MFLFLTVQGGFVHADIRFNFENCYKNPPSHLQFLITNY